MIFQKTFNLFLGLLTVLVASPLYGNVTDKSSQFRTYLIEAMKADGFSDTEIKHRALHPEDFRGVYFPLMGHLGQYSPIDLYKPKIENSEIFVFQ